MSFVLGIEGIQEFEENVKKICDYAFAHAIRTFRPFDPETASRSLGHQYSEIQ